MTSSVLCCWMRWERERRPGSSTWSCLWNHRLAASLTWRPLFPGVQVLGSAVTSLHPLSIPLAIGQRLLPGRGRPGEAGQPAGNSPSLGEDNPERGGSSAAFRSPGQLPAPEPLPAAVAAGRSPERKTEAGQHLGHTPLPWRWSGLGRRPEGWDI